MPAPFSLRIPLYNGGTTIETTLASLVAQTDEDWECIVVDDASTDDSVLRARWVDDPRIEVQARPDNVGMTANWNRALATATGAYTILLGHDDALTPDALAVLRATFDAHPDVALVGFGAVVPRDEGPDLHHARRHAGRIGPDALREFAIRASDTPAPSQAAYRTSVLQTLLPLDETFRYCPEIDLQFRLGAAGHPAIYLTDCIGIRRNDATRITARVRHTPVPLRDHYRLVEKHGSAEGAAGALQRRRLRRQAGLEVLRALRRGRVRSALSFAKTVVVHERRIALMQ
jgi:glycosyltransferase involved in cell wall biosynthesis